MNGSSKLILKLLPFLVVILVGILVNLLTKLDIYMIIIFTSVLLLITLILFFHEKFALFHRLAIIGIKKIIPPDKRRTDEPNFLYEADTHIWILGTSLQTFWDTGNSFITHLGKVGRKNVAIDILLLNPESEFLSEKAIDEKKSKTEYRESIETSIEKFQNFKRDKGIRHMDLYLYDDFPIWHMLIIDRKFAKISYYPYGEDASTRPYYVFDKRGKYNILDPFIMYFEKLRKKSKKVES